MDTHPAPRRHPLSIETTQVTSPSVGHGGGGAPGPNSMTWLRGGQRWELAGGGSWRWWWSSAAEFPKVGASPQVRLPRPCFVRCLHQLWGRGCLGCAWGRSRVAWLPRVVRWRQLGDSFFAHGKQRRGGWQGALRKSGQPRGGAGIQSVCGVQRGRHGGW